MLCYEQHTDLRQGAGLKESNGRWLLKCIFAESAINPVLVRFSHSSIFTREDGFKDSYLSAMLSVSTLSYYLDASIVHRL